MPTVRGNVFSASGQHQNRTYYVHILLVACFCECPLLFITLLRKLKENEIDKENGTYGEDEEFIEGFDGETRRKETT